MIITRGSITILNANLATGVATPGSTVGLNPQFTPLNPQPPVPIYSPAKDVNNLMVQVSGTWTGTLTVQCTLDCVNWDTFGLVAPILTGVGAATITGNGIYTLAIDAITGAQQARVTASGAITGTAVVTIVATK